MAYVLAFKLNQVENPFSLKHIMISMTLKKLYGY
jgi:hypothetical protein